VFHPRGLSPDDAKVRSHPVDFVVFNGESKAEQLGDLTNSRIPCCSTGKPMTETTIEFNEAVRR